MEEGLNYATIFFNILILCLLLLVFFLFLKIFDSLYISFFKRPAWVHFYFFKKKLSVSNRNFLNKNLSFYARLSKIDKKRFEHRLCNFLVDKSFISRENFALSEEKKILISATAIMLTFGMRKYMLPILEKIIIYPNEFYSTVNDQFHKGEFNPSLNALVLSWKDFEEGYRIDDDNVNLGIHEFTHAIHLNSIKRSDTASIVFSDGFTELLGLLRNDSLVADIRNSGVIREYAFTNEFEFLAVVVENFIESPLELKAHFPSVYNKIRQMFNFRFAGY
jgi:MtfA peptidase